MLTQIHIQGLAIIESLDIDFTPGFNVITGETGAGKSILIKALALLLGGKASSDTVRKGFTTATISGTFCVPASHAARDVLEDIGIPLELYGAATKERFDILVRRSLSTKGRSGAWINDIPVTVTKLKEFAECLIDVFAQHENHKLLDPQLHTIYVDQFLKSPKTRDKVQELHDDIYGDYLALTALVKSYRERQRDADYLRFRHAELTEFAPSVEDFEATKEICHTAHNSLGIRESITAASAAIDSGADGEPLSAAAWEASKHLDKLARTSPIFQAIADQAKLAAQALDDLSYSLGQGACEVEVDDGELEAAQERLAGYQELMRKMAAHDIGDLVQELLRLTTDLGFLDSASLDVIELLKKMSHKTKELKLAAAALSKERIKAAERLKNALEKELHELAMPGASLSVRFEAVNKALAAPDLSLFGDDALQWGADVFETLSEISSQGNEQARLYLGSNRGEGESALHKVASGGEISRIMLGFKRALSAGADTCILVFDEIDTGISGRVADVVGHKLRELAQGFQVICISHLAQVAAYADTHFRVSKKPSGGRTESTIELLSAKDSQDEIARLLSGDEVTKSSLANAKQLIKKAKEKQV